MDLQIRGRIYALNKIMRNILLAIMIIILLTSLGYCQNTQNLIEEVTNLYNCSEGLGSNLIAGFSWAGLIGGILFGSIGFIAFVYGKKNAKFKPMLIGALLMVYPYFVKNTIAMYLAGIALTAVLFIWRK